LGEPFHIVALLPQQITQGRSFLHALHLEIADVRQASFADLGVSATPTLILVNSSGQVEASWVGKLSAQQEAEVFSKLKVTRPASASVEEGRKGAQPADLMTASELAELIGTSPDPIPIIDIRSRTDYARGHISESLNIPEEELEARALHEVPRHRLAVVYCHYCIPCETHKAESPGTGYVCELGRKWLHNLGFSQFRVLGDDLTHLKRAGVPVVGDSGEDVLSGSTPINPTQ